MPCIVDILGRSTFLWRETAEEWIWEREEVIRGEKGGETAVGIWCMKEECRKKKKKTLYPSCCWWYTSLILAIGWQWQKDHRVWGQPGVHIAFQDTQCYRIRTCLKDQVNQPTNQINNKPQYLLTTKIIYVSLFFQLHIVLTVWSGNKDSLSEK